MTRLRPIAGIATAAALTFALSACGGGSEYCDLLESADSELNDLSAESLSDPEALSDAQSRFQEIADAAPDDVQETWQNAADAIQLLVDADGDFTSIDPEAAEELASMDSDMTVLEESAQEECDIDIS